MTEHRGPQDLTLLIEQHQKDIWEWKQKESQWIRDKNLLDGNKRIIEELSTRLVEMGKDNLALKKRAQEAEGETTIVKGIGLNSPEMKALQARVNELEGTLGSAQDINDNHQRYNGKLQTRLTEVEEDNKKLAKQIEHLTTARKFGDGTH
jgi:chromosome segregation ATPase